MPTANRLGAFVALGVFFLVACGGSEDDGATQLRHGSSTSAADNDTSAFGSSTPGDSSGKSCEHDTDCDDHDACTQDNCLHSGEFSHCENTPIADAGTCSAPSSGSDNGGALPDGFINPIDTACESSPNMPSVFPPFVALQPDDVPATCHGGFELQQAEPQSVYTLSAKTAQGSRAITLDVDFATYVKPDGMTITGIDASGKEYTLLDTCRLQTWTKADPTGGQQRPPDETIRQFRIQVLAGTKQLKVSFGLVVSPMYLRIVGLCDFNVTTFTNGQRWAAVP